MLPFGAGSLFGIRKVCNGAVFEVATNRLHVDQSSPRVVAAAHARPLRIAASIPLG
jgi:hypothetical protein